jgi:ABC-type sugar transport system ATPase subunit
MVYVTHDQEEAMTLGTRVAVMHDGAIEQVAPPLELFRRPANLFVARFVGSPAMNLWRCRCRPLPGGVRLDSAGFSIDVATPDVAPSHRGEVWLGIRPHELELVSSGDGDCAGRVDVVEPLGAVTVIHLRVDGRPDEFVRVAAPADTVMAVNDTVSVRIRRDRVQLFDAKTERRLN